ncbi:holo-ACP synthase [Brunnivagina elsteri]|uniref:Holo-[acyl-carrier-protein] synthase n=1 Tax=Brunnivagina elsteri CCALA 953 TaxID=987040 RepID=A0A2A2TLY3_9CYAN|nr:holo-ACP synthase [Calothrix elsteri]PAX59412.1 holo-[acyl-carrier-protein] synthase [Calothrix elsteri CCALA 953]
MTIRLGTDIVYIPRIRALIDRFGKRFLQRVYTPIEQQNSGYREEEITPMAIAKLAGRWAAKEAVVKALGTGWQGINYTDVEICRTQNGVPFPTLYNNAAEIVAKWGVEEKSEGEKGNTPDPNHGWQLSLSHDRDYAIATAIFVAL